jgi:hypothetical protein
MTTSARINLDLLAMEGPDEPTDVEPIEVEPEVDYADFWIPVCDEEFGHLSMMENLKALVGDRKRGDDPAQKEPEVTAASTVSKASLARSQRIAPRK